MNYLHILRSEPDELVRRFIATLSEGKETRQVPLYDGRVDYDQLVKDIFRAQKVICWW